MADLWATPRGSCFVRWGSEYRVSGEHFATDPRLIMFPMSSLQLFSSSSESFRSVGSSLLLLFAMLRGSVNLRPCLPESSGLYYLFCTSYIILEVWIVLRLFTVVLIYSYREMHFELYRPAFEPQDYEMVELFVRRLKMWMGFSKAKEVSAAWEILWRRGLVAGSRLQVLAENRCPPSLAFLCLWLLPTAVRSHVPLAGEGWSSVRSWRPKSWVSDGVL